MTARIAASTPRSGALAVVRILEVKRRSPSSSATSVKVPPISTPRRAVGAGDVTRCLKKSAEAADAPCWRPLGVTDMIAAFRPVDNCLRAGLSGGHIDVATRQPRPLVKTEAFEAA